MDRQREGYFLRVMVSREHVDGKLVISNDYLSLDIFLLGKSYGRAKSTCVPSITPSLLRIST